MASATTSPGKRARTKSIKHPVDQILPIPKLGVYGLQHVLAFYAGAVVVPILLAGAIGLTEEQLIHLINADLFTCGIASIIQSIGFWKVGVKLPLLQGVTFTAVSPMIAIALANGGGTEGLLYIYGAVIVAGSVHLLHRAVFRQADPILPAGRHRHRDHHHRYRTAARRGAWTPSAAARTRTRPAARTWPTRWARWRSS